MTATSLNISGRLVALTLAPRSNSCRVSINLYARRKASWSIRFIKNDTRLPSVTSTYLHIHHTKKNDQVLVILIRITGPTRHRHA